MGNLLFVILILAAMINLEDGALHHVDWEGRHLRLKNLKHLGPMP